MSFWASQRPLQRVAVLLLEARKAAGEWRMGSRMPNTLFLVDTKARSEDSWVMGAWMIRPPSGHGGSSGTS